jgi:hypothetical protein
MKSIIGMKVQRTEILKDLKKKFKKNDDVFPCHVFIGYKHDIYELRKIYKILHRRIHPG